MKIAEIITRINEIIAEMSEYTAKVLHPAAKCNRNHSATIPPIANIPDATTRTRCIFPLKVINSPPASRGKKKATSIPNPELVRNKRGPTIEPPPSVIPSCNPMKNTNNKTLDVIMSDCDNCLLGAPTANSELISFRI